MTKGKSVKSPKVWKTISVVLFISILIGLFFFLFSGSNFNVLKEIFRNDATKEEIRASIDKLGYKAQLVVAILAMLQVVFTFVPGEPLHVISGISFGLWQGILICFIGILLGNTIVYLLHKLFGAKLTDYFSTNVDFDFTSAKASNKIALIVIILYCLPAIPYGIICFFAASLGMKYSKYILITGVGSLPSLLLDVGLGHITMSTSWIVSIVVFAIIVVLLILMAVFKKQIFAKVNQYIAKSREKSAKRVGKYNSFTYWCVGTLFYNYIKSKIKIKLKNNVGKLDKPSIVLCSHGSFYDFVYAGKLLRKEKPHFVVARMYFHHKLLGKIISGTGAFPKSMFSTDIDNVRDCLKVISSNEILAMMPEARLSTAGKFEDIQEQTIKFIKKMNVSVYTINIKGSYLANPKWGNKIRKGSVVEAELNQLFKGGELNDLSLDDVKTKITDALYYNEWEWLENHPQVNYKNKQIAEGLQNILYVCPKCLKQHTLSTKNNSITCSACDLKVELDNRYQMSGCQFKNILEWYEWQTELLRKELNENPNYCLESKVELKHLSKDGKKCTRPSGYGVCKLDRTGLKYVGTEDGKEIEKFFPIDTIYRILFGAGEDFEIYDGKELYYFVPEDKSSCVKWYILSGLLKENNQ